VVGMSITKDINRLLDDMLHIKSEINRMRADLKSNQTLVNNQTGEKISANKIEELANNEINEIKKELNKITNEGKRARGLFDNVYYVNDTIQDKLLVQAESEDTNK
jgi:HAMP domain-containing protein